MGRTKSLTTENSKRDLAAFHKFLNEKGVPFYGLKPEKLSEYYREFLNSREKKE